MSDWARVADLDHENRQLKAEIGRLRAALELYADPFAWKRKHDPDDEVRVPDFYSETDFGDTAKVALSSPIEREGK